MADSTEWEFCDPFLPKRLLDGQRSSFGETLMRRRVKGVWQYRRLTPKESAEWVSMTAW